MEVKPTYEELERRVQELEKIESELEFSKEALGESENLFRMLYEKAPLGYQSLDENGHFIVVNKTWLETLGYKEEEVLGKSFADFLHPEWRSHFKENFPQFKAIGEILGVEFEMVKKNGDLILVSFTGKINRDEKGDFQQTHCIFHDITERKRTEEALRESEERFKCMVNEAPLGIAIVDSLNAKFYLVNPAMARITGRSIEVLEQIDWVNITHPDDIQPDNDNMAAMNAGKIPGFQMEKRYLHADGHYFWVNITVAPMSVVDKSKPRHLLMAEDITVRKHHEQQLAAALIEKEVLLREVHHRVKNNLAAIISLMAMQRRSIEDPGSQVILTELSNRIRSMSLVHEKLYRADSLATIDFHDYVQALTSHLRTTFGSPDVVCRVDAPGVTIPLYLASPCGLIVNELMTNTLKYAFPDGKPRLGNSDCRILVRLHRDNDTYTLTVADNGIGWPAGFDWSKSRTLGLTLVRMLGQHQLGGHYVVDHENGTSITLTFTDRKIEVPVHG